MGTNGQEDETEGGKGAIVVSGLPVLDVEAAKNAMVIYQQLCAAVLVPWGSREFEQTEDGRVIKVESDYQRIRTKVKNEEGKDEQVWRDFPKKSAWRKLARFYGVSTEIMDKERTVREDGTYIWSYTVRATSKDGVSQMGEGSCDSNEITNARRKEHDTKATAHTRAKNRAISDLIGFGQVSAEEVSSPGDDAKVVDASYAIIDDLEQIMAEANVDLPTARAALEENRSVNVAIYNLKADALSREPKAPEESEPEIEKGEEAEPTEEREPKEEEEQEPEEAPFEVKLPEPPEVIGMSWMENTLKESGVDIVALSIQDTADAVVIRKKGFLSEKAVKKINGIVTQLGGEWIKDAAKSHWKIVK